MPDLQRVVITGVGVVSPVGNDAASAWSSLLAGTSGIGPVTRFNASELPVRIAGEVKGFDPAERIGGKEINRMDLSQLYGLAASDEALAQARLGREHPEGWDPLRVGVYMGSGIGGILSYEHNYDVFLSRGPRRVSPFLVPMLCSNLIPGNIAIRHNFKGPNLSHVTACATASSALGEAYRAIKHGYADVLVAGGAESAITGLTISGFARMRALSTSNERGQAASRPFDRRRDGFVIAEGAAALVLESLESAQRRGVPVLAEICGYGATCDAFHQTAPAEGGEGIVRAMRMALDENGARPEQVGYVNAHGTSTPFNDKHETAAIRTVFADHADQLAVSSTKSMSGHMLGASGALEAVACVLGLGQGKVHPTINLDDPDPDCDLDYVPGEARALDHEYAVSNSMGFGGQNASLLFKRWDA